MNIGIVIDYCLAKKGAKEDLPFDDKILVIRVMERIFILIPLDNPTSISLKCDPDLAIELRSSYPFVTPGFHLNKKHWNTIQIDGSVTETLIKSWIDHSYEQVLQKLPKKIRTQYDELPEP